MKKASGGRAASPAETPTSEAIEVGYVAGVHGVHGALRIRLHDDQSESLQPGVHVDLRVRGGGALTHRDVVETIELGARSELRVELEGIRDRDAAEGLKSHGVWIARAELPALEADEFYLADTIGAEVIDHPSGLSLGKVCEISSNGAQDLLEVEWRNERGKRHKWLFPLVGAYLAEIGDAAIRVDLPEGLMPDALEAAVAEARGQGGGRAALVDGEADDGEPA